MSKQASPALVGAFVVGAIALLVVGMLVFGGTQLFSKQQKYVIHFPGAVNGLTIGAPVNFRGVKIGEVIDIRAVYEFADESLHIPVVLEIEPDRITLVRQQKVVEQEDYYKRLIELGLRARLQTDSMLTGLLSINLDFYPGTQVTLIDNDGPYPELPAIPSRMEELEKTLTLVMRDAPRLMTSLTTLLTGLSEFQAQLSQNYGENREAVNEMVADLASLLDNLERAGLGVDRLMNEGTDTLAAIRSSADHVDEIFQANREPLSLAITNLSNAAASIERMADQVNNMVAENREGIRDFTAMGLYEINGLAQDTQRMVDQISRVAEQLERDPGRFLFGDQTQGVRAE